MAPAKPLVQAKPNRAAIKKAKLERQKAHQRLVTLRVMRKLVRTAKSKIGKPYVWGAAGPNAFDCSGFVDYTYRQIGRDFPGRITTWTARRLGRSVRHEKLQAGDMIINNYGQHMSLYVGDGVAIESPHSGAYVRYSPVSQERYGLVDIRRVLRTLRK